MVYHTQMALPTTTESEVTITSRSESSFRYHYSSGRGPMRERGDVIGRPSQRMTVKYTSEPAMVVSANSPSDAWSHMGWAWMSS